MTTLLLHLISFYRFLRRVLVVFLSSLIPATGCRFTPSCSHYCQIALSRYGVIKGSTLCLGRIARCHPFSPQRFDPVP